jgi:hypothetical protein
VPPGQSRTVTLTEGGTDASARVVLTGDDAAFDNSIFVIPPKTDEIRIVFLGQEAEDDTTQALYYLRRAFQETRQQKVNIVVRKNDEALSPTELAEVQLIIICDELAEARAQQVKQWVEQGKTILLSMKSPSMVRTLGGLVGVANPGAEEARADEYAMFSQIDFQHPLFAPFADPRFSDFTKIHFWKHRRVNAAEFPGSRVLARFDGPTADPAVMQIPAGKGQIFALTFGWFPSDSQFALSSKFVPLLYSILEISGAIKVQAAQYVVGDRVELSLESAEPLSIRKPDGVEVKLSAGDRFADTQLPGIYSVQAGPSSTRFAVNLAGEESKTAPLPGETLERLGVPLKLLATASPRQQRQAAAARQRLAATELENRQKLWRWLIVAALVVLMMETWLAGRISRRAAAETEVTI